MDLSSDVEPYLRGTDEILRTLWRTVDRPSEPQLYAILSEETLPGVAKFLCGGDVLYMDHDRVQTAITSRMTTDPNHSSTRILHRLVLDSVEGLFVAVRVRLRDVILGAHILTSFCCRSFLYFVRT